MCTFVGGATTIDCTFDSANGISEYGYDCDLEGYGSSKFRLLSSGPLHIPSMPHSPVRPAFSLKNIKNVRLSISEVSPNRIIKFQYFSLS